MNTEPAIVRLWWTYSPEKGIGLGHSISGLPFEAAIILEHVINNFIGSPWHKYGMQPLECELVNTWRKLEGDPYGRLTRDPFTWLPRQFSVQVLSGPKCLTAKQRYQRRRQRKWSRLCEERAVKAGARSLREEEDARMFEHLEHMAAEEAHGHHVRA